MRRKTLGESTFTVCNAAVLALLTLTAIYPILHVLFASLSDPFLMMTHNGLLFRPLGFSLSAYREVLNNPNIFQGYKNTIFIVVVGTALNLFLTTMAAYALSRKTLRTRNFFMMAIIFTMMFSGGQIPLYLVVQDLGLFNSIWSLILPTAVNTMNLTIMRTSFAEVPVSLEESARIDGANDFTILFRIVLPLSKAVMAVMVLYYGVYHWNAWFHAALFLRVRDKMPLQLILREILIMNDTRNMTAGTSNADTEQIAATIKYATIMVSTLPILCLYPFLQKYFVKGVMIGAVKG